MVEAMAAAAETVRLPPLGGQSAAPHAKVRRGTASDRGQECSGSRKRPVSSNTRQGMRQRYFDYMKELPVSQNELPNDSAQHGAMDTTWMV